MNTPASSYQCARCQFFDGVCRKNPPRIVEGGRMAAWPIIANPSLDWCGQFSPKRHAPWTATTVEGETK